MANFNLKFGYQVFIKNILLFLKKTIDKSKISAIIIKVMMIWSVGQGVKTPPFHGGNTGSNPVRTIAALQFFSLSGIAQLVEHLICNQRVACSSHVAGITIMI